jgi:hypothetical protein
MLCFFLEHAGDMLCVSGQFDSFKREQTRIKKVQERLQVKLMFLISYVSYKTKIILSLREKKMNIQLLCRSH